jgi:hypothetical protein
LNPTSAEYEGISKTRIAMVGWLEMPRKKSNRILGIN